MQADTRTIPEATTAERLRALCACLRIKPTPLADIIPVLQKAADELDAARAPVDAKPIAWRWVNPDGTVEFTTVAPELYGYLATMLAMELGRKAEPLYLSAQEAAPQQGDWRPIESAPKYERLLLWFPAFGPWIASAWPGSWSYAREQWVIHSPFGTPDGKALFGTDAPQPTHWMPLLNPPASLQQHDQQEG